MSHITVILLILFPNICTCRWPLVNYSTVPGVQVTSIPPLISLSSQDVSLKCKSNYISVISVLPKPFHHYHCIWYQVQSADRGHMPQWACFFMLFIGLHSLWPAFCLWNTKAHSFPRTFSLAVPSACNSLFSDHQVSVSFS